MNNVTPYFILNMTTYFILNMNMKYVNPPCAPGWLSGSRSCPAGDLGSVSFWAAEELACETHESHVLVNLFNQNHFGHVASPRQHCAMHDGWLRVMGYHEWLHDLKCLTLSCHPSGAVWPDVSLSPAVMWFSSDIASVYLSAVSAAVIQWQDVM